MTIFDVAAYILRERGQMTAMKLQKLAYYAQAWSLVWDDRPLFTEQIQAWANGPVAPSLYQAHKGQFELVDGSIAGDPAALDHDAVMTVQAVLKNYGDKSSQWLSDLTHAENPWVEARQGLPSGHRGDRVISHAAMAEYYGSL